MISIAPISIYDVAAQQAWLEDLARRGRFLRTHDGALARFDRGAPKAFRYRLEAIAERPAPDDDRPREDQLETYRDCGWAYVCRIGGSFDVWRCDDPAAPELFTDPETERQAYLHLRRRLRRRSCLLGAVVLWLAALAWWSHRTFPGTWLLSLARQPNDLLSILAANFLLVFFTVRLTWENHMLRRLIRSLGAGVPVARGRPFRLKAGLNGAFWTLMLLLIACQFLRQLPPDRENTASLAEADLPAGFVSLTALEPGTETSGEMTWGPGVLSSAYWRTRETDGRGGVLAIEYFRLRLPVLGPALEDRLRREYPQGQKLVLRQGGELLSVIYIGPADLSDHEDLFRLPPGDK